MRKPIIVAVVVFFISISHIDFLFTAQTNNAKSSKKTSTFWVRFLVHGKGDDFLFVIEHPARVSMPRRLRCRTSLPTFVEKIAAVTESTNGILIAKVAGTIFRDSIEEESIDDLQVMSLCILGSEALSEFIEAQTDVNSQQNASAGIIEKGKESKTLVPDRSPIPKRPLSPVAPIQGGPLPR